MKKQTIIYFVILAVMLLLAVSIASAQDGDLPDNGIDYAEGTTLNDLNWCYEGQPWSDGRCNDPDPWISEWHWTCGWYWAHYDLGYYDNVPTWCGHPLHHTMQMLHHHTM